MGDPNWVRKVKKPCLKFAEDQFARRTNQLKKPRHTSLTTRVAMGRTHEEEPIPHPRMCHFEAVCSFLVKSQAAQVPRIQRRASTAVWRPLVLRTLRRKYLAGTRLGSAFVP